MEENKTPVGQIGEGYRVPTIDEFVQDFEFEIAREMGMYIPTGEGKLKRVGVSHWHWAPMKVTWKCDPDELYSEKDGEYTVHSRGSFRNFFKPINEEAFIKSGMVRVKTNSKTISAWEYLKLQGLPTDMVDRSEQMAKEISEIMRTQTPQSNTDQYNQARKDYLEGKVDRPNYPLAHIRHGDDFITALGYALKALDPQPTLEVEKPFKLFSEDLLQEFLDYNPSPPPHRGPGADWNAVCEYERKRLHERIDRIFNPRPWPPQGVSDFMLKKGFEVKNEPKFITTIDPFD